MREIDWIKSAVSVCIANDLSENEKKTKFGMLEKQYEMLPEENQNNIKKILKEQFAVNDLIYIYSVFVQYMENKLFAEDMIDAVLTGEFDVITGTMLELHVTRYAGSLKKLYKKRRILHKTNVKKFEQILQIQYPYIEPVNRNKKRIVIITEQILGMNHSPTRVVLYFAYILKKLGYEILLFACPCDGFLAKDIFCHAMGMNSKELFQNVPINMTFRDEIIAGYQINMTKMMMKEYHMMLALIYAWNPIFVFELGTVNPIADLTGKFTTLVSMEMSVLCPVSEGKILIRAAHVDEVLEKEYEEALGENQKQLFLEEKFPVIIEDDRKICTRADIGLPEERFLAAIVGNRLDTEMSDIFIKVMGIMLENISCLDFVIIGVAEALKERLKDEIFENRVYFLGYQSELMKVYGVLDLYLNLERTGGGFSGAMALIAGMPVVTLPNCDVANNVGEEFIVDDYEMMIETVARYVNDRDYYNQKVKEAGHYKEKNTDAALERYAQKFLNGVLKLIDEGNRE